MLKYQKMINFSQPRPSQPDDLGEYIIWDDKTHTGELARRLNVDEEEIERVINLKKNHFSNIYKQFAEYCEELMKRYSRKTLQKCAVFHLFAGSTARWDQIKMWDLPGKDSIVERVEKWVKELEEQNLNKT